MIGFDTNILIYALDPTDAAKHRTARHLLDRALLADAAIAAQVLGEYLNATRRKMPNLLGIAIEVTQMLTATLPILPTTADTVVRAGQVARDHRLSFWDSLIVDVYATAGASALLTEDGQDGRRLRGLVLINPFEAINASRIAGLLDG